MTAGIAPLTARPQAELDQLSIDTIRTLSIDAVQQARRRSTGTACCPPR